jgi:hypothetical protein
MRHGLVFLRDQAITSCLGAELLDPAVRALVFADVDCRSVVLLPDHPGSTKACYCPSTRPAAGA